MRSIAIINQKGGVGKTTTAVNLAAALSESGQRVCILDLDPQAHASLHLGLAAADGDSSIYRVLTGDASLAEVRQKVCENLWVVPAHIDLAAVEMELSNTAGRETILHKKLAVDDAPLDYLIIDCPPSLGVLTLNALTAVREIVLPLQPHFLALHGLSKLLRTIDLVGKRMNPGLRLTGVLLCMYESGTRLAAEVTEDVRQFFLLHSDGDGLWAGARLFEARIRRNIRLAEAPSFGQSILQYAPQSHGAEDYRQLTRELYEIHRRQPSSAFSAAR